MQRTETKDSRLRENDWVPRVSRQSTGIDHEWCRVWLRAGACHQTKAQGSV